MQVLTVFAGAPLLQQVKIVLLLYIIHIATRPPHHLVKTEPGLWGKRQGEGKWFCGTGKLGDEKVLSFLIRGGVLFSICL